MKSADKLLSSPLSPHLFSPYASADTSLTPCGQISLSMLSGISMYRSIWLEYYSLSLRYLENTGASAVCLLPKHPAAACLIWQSYQGTSHTHISPAAQYTDKGLLRVQSTSKTTGDTLPPRVVLPFGPCSSLTNAENAVPNPQMEQFLTTKEQRDDFECHTCLNEYLI